MDDKTYTMPELAGLIGVPVKVVSNAKYSKSAPRPGSNIHLVIEKMKEMGITWDHVVSAPRGGYKGRRNTPTVDASLAAPESCAEPHEPEITDTKDCCAGDGCESVDRPMPLEDAIAALRRRLPGASITITIA